MEEDKKNMENEAVNEEQQERIDRWTELMFGRRRAANNPQEEQQEDKEETKEDE